MIASWGGKVFSVDPTKINTFSGFQYTSTLSTEKQDGDSTKISSSKVSRFTKPSTYIKGCDLDTISFKITLDVQMGVNPRNEWGDWKRLCESMTPYPFIMGGVPLSSGTNFLLTNVSIGSENIDGNGKMLAVEISLKFEEYVRAGSKKDTATSGKGTTDIFNQVMGTADEEEKQGLKRTNPNIPEDILDAPIPESAKESIRRARGM